MKHLPKANNHHLTQSEHDSELFSGEIYADSLEVLENHCRQKLLQLHGSLEQLNVADNAIEIISVCREIKKEQAKLTCIGKRKERN